MRRCVEEWSTVELGVLFSLDTERCVAVWTAHPRRTFRCRCRALRAILTQRIVGSGSVWSVDGALPELLDQRPAHFRVDRRRQDFGWADRLCARLRIRERRFRKHATCVSRLYSATRCDA